MLQISVKNPLEEPLREVGLFVVVLADTETCVGTHDTTGSTTSVLMQTRFTNVLPAQR